MADSTRTAPDAVGVDASWAVRDVRAVLPDRVIDGATVVVEDGRVVSVVAGALKPAGALDGRGAWCLPGLVDTHSDGLEKEVQPRAGVTFPVGLALAGFEGRVRAAGITTVFHGVAFEENPGYGRSVALADGLCDAIAARVRAVGPLVDHRLLLRLDARDAHGLAALRRRLDLSRVRAEPGAPAPLVSFEDHTPGQGQYADPATYRAHLRASKGLTEQEATAAVDALVAERDALVAQRATSLAWLSEAALAGQVRFLAHDPTDEGDIADAVAAGASVAEFPTTVEAAEAARAAGMDVVMGAPNVLRGGSHSGNVAAEELVRRGLCTALASDYLPTSLLAAAFTLVDRGATSLPAAVRLVTAGAAAAAGHTDRGRLEPGGRGDAVLVTLDGPWPTVRAVWRASS